MNFGLIAAFLRCRWTDPLRAEINHGYCSAHAITRRWFTVYIAYFDCHRTFQLTPVRLQNVDATARDEANVWRMC